MLNKYLILVNLSLFALVPAFTSGAQNSLGNLSGMIEIEKAKSQHRIAQRYADTQLSELGPPAPLVAIVYLTQDSPFTLPKEKPTAIVEQRGLWFYPSVLPIVVGTKVEFPNLDNTYHNVFSYSSAKRFDLGRYSKGEGPPYEIFDQPGVVNIFCEVHEHMRATILVLETPYFTTTDESGGFEMDDIPAGDYVVNVWISNRNQWSFPMTLTNGSNEFPHSRKPK